MLALGLLMTVGCSEPLTKREQGGLLGGALIGDQLMSQDKRQDEQQRAIDRNQDESARLRRESQRLREQTVEP